MIGLHKGLNQEEVAALATALAATLKIGDIVLLNGTLGAGKTYFSSKLITGLQMLEDMPITSPTFNIVHNYQTKRGTVWHYDLYRLNEPEESHELALDDAFTYGITLIEWPDIIYNSIPKPHFMIEISHCADDRPDTRDIKIELIS